MSTVMNHKRMVRSAYDAVLEKKSGMEGTNKPKLDQNWKTSPSCGRLRIYIYS